MVVERGKVSYVGPERGAQRWMNVDYVKIVDLGGRAVLPGKHYSSNSAHVQYSSELFFLFFLLTFEL